MGYVRSWEVSGAQGAGQNLERRPEDALCPVPAVITAFRDLGVSPWFHLVSSNICVRKNGIYHMRNGYLRNRR